MRTLALLCSASILMLAACGGDEKPAPKTEENAKTEVTAEKTGPAPTSTPTTAGDEKKPESGEAKAEEKKPEPPKKKPSEIVVGSTFMFSLADSPDAKKAADDACAKKAKKDDKKLEACKKDAETAAAGEGIRFEKTGEDLYWVSFGNEKGKEVVYNKVKVKPGTEGDGKISFTPEGKDSGKKAMKTLPKEMSVDVPDDGTVIMNDPKKGKLTYKKK